MYIVLSVVAVVIGLLLLFQPFGALRGALSVVLRVTGVVLCIAGAVLIYALLSGKIVLPLIK